MRRADDVCSHGPVGAAGRDEGGDDGQARTVHQARHFGHAADVFMPVFGRKTEVAVQAMAQLVAVEHRHGAALRLEPARQRLGDAGLAGAAQARQPDRDVLSCCHHTASPL